MFKTKFIEIISILPHESRKKLKDFIESPYFNKEQSVKIIGTAILDQLNKEPPKLEKADLFSLAFGTKPYDDTAIRVVLSKLYKLTLHFINTEYKISASELNTNTLLFLRKNHLDDHFLETLNKSKIFLKTQPLRNEKYYDGLYLILQEEYEYLKAQKRQGDYQTKEIYDGIEISYFIKKLRHCTRINTIKTINTLDLEFAFIDEIINYITNTELYKIPVLGFYYYTYLSQVFPEQEEHFKSLVGIISDSESDFDWDELRDNYFTILNYCIRKINAGDDGYLKTLFELYVKSLDKGFLIEKNTISRFTYRNIAETGIKVNEFTWVDEFISVYKNRLEEKYQTSFYALEKARLLIVQKEFNKALDYLSRISFTDPLIELANRLEKIRIFIELKQSDVADYQLDAMNSYLRRNKGIGYHREHYRQFIYYTKKLIRITSIDKTQLHELLLQVRNEPKLTERKWLLSKLEAM